MNTTTKTFAPAGLRGLGGSAMRSCTDRDLRTVIGVSSATSGAPLQGTAVPAGSTAARLRPEVQVSAQDWTAPNTFAHNSIGTTLGNCSSRRPQS